MVADQTERHGVLRSVLLVAVAFLFCFLVVETCVRLYLHYYLVYDVEMSRYAMTLKRDSSDWHIGHEHRPDAQARLMGVLVRTNSDGFRGKDVPVERSTKKRLLFLGDSLTLGWGVTEQDTFASILESKLSASAPVEMINTGTGNYNTEQEAYLFFEKGLKYRPDKVVLFYFINDVEPTPHKSGLWFLGYSEAVTFYWSRFHILLESVNPAKSYRSYYSSLYQEGQPGLDASRRAFLALRDVCRKNGIAFQVVLLAEQHQLAAYPFAKEHQMTMDFLNVNGINALDLAPYFANEKKPMDLWVSPDDAHPNAKAHHLIADYVVDFVKKGLF